MSATLVISLLLATYMLQQVNLPKKIGLLRLRCACYQVSNLYQEYQKASRLEGYLGDLEGVRIGFDSQWLMEGSTYHSSPPCFRWWRTLRNFRVEWKLLNINIQFLARLWRRVSISSWPMTRGGELASIKLVHLKRVISEKYFRKKLAVNVNQSFAKIQSQSIQICALLKVIQNGSYKSRYVHIQVWIKIWNIVDPFLFKSEECWIFLSNTNFLLRNVLFRTNNSFFRANIRKESRLHKPNIGFENHVAEISAGGRMWSCLLHTASPKGSFECVKHVGQVSGCAHCLGYCSNRLARCAQRRWKSRNYLFWYCNFIT